MLNNARYPVDVLLSLQKFSQLLVLVKRLGWLWKSTILPTKIFSDKYLHLCQIFANDDVLVNENE